MFVSTGSIGGYQIREVNHFGLGGISPLSGQPSEYALGCKLT